MTVYRIAWRPGTDQLVGHCHCGAEHIGEDPIEMWTWLLGHPDGHEPLPALPEPATAGGVR
jgi:hypothetical protein